MALVPLVFGDGLLEVRSERERERERGAEGEGKRGEGRERGGRGKEQTGHGRLAIVLSRSDKVDTMMAA